MKNDMVWNHCGNCKQRTNHDIVGTHTKENHPDDYHCMVEHSVVKCRGCNTVSFRKVVHDYEGAYPTENDEWEVPLEIETYPKELAGSINTRHLPDIVEQIYNETCRAYADDSLTLASIGFRATIEAICNDQEIAGKELSTRINNLAAKGLISKKDSARLHSIRFMGNDAAHDIKRPSPRSLKAALIIVEHLITTVYILERESAGKLDAIIEDYSNFEILLNKKLLEFSRGDEYPLAKLLGKDIRLISGSTKTIEQALDARIGKGEYTKLKFGRKDSYLGSKDPLQHYVVA
ncbi:DUF4145 domain-containing protein [Pseudomonas yamanorum]|uniref:DUF4145 domain-containing protein n=1 Tax=Pseudomonas yamanorum TaxID=515393 RepID=UPI003F75673D